MAETRSAALAAFERYIEEEYGTGWKVSQYSMTGDDVPGLDRKSGCRTEIMQFRAVLERQWTVAAIETKEAKTNV